MLLFLLISISVSAQDKLETIHVSGDKDPLAYNFGDTKILNSEDIKLSGSPFMAELLKSVSSIMVVQNGGPGGRQSYFLRGTESRHVAFMLDHLKVNDPTNNDRHFDSAFTLMPDIEEVVVFKTPQPVLYGSDAIGGVILLKTRKGPAEGEQPMGKLSVGGGSFSSFQESFLQDWTKTKDQGTISVSHYQTMGLSRLNKKRTKSTERDGAEVLNLGSSSTHKWSRFESDLLFKYIHGVAEQDGYDNSGENADTNDRSYSDQYLAQHKTRIKSDLGNFQLRQGLNRYHRRILTKLGGEETFSGSNLANEMTLVSKLGALETTSGLSYEHESFADQSIEKNFDLSSLYFHSKYQLGVLSVHGGLRGDHHSRYGNFYSGATGLNLNFGPLEIFGQYAQGVKAPTLYQLFAPPSYGAPIGNKNLRPETNKTTEAGIKLKTENQDLVITAFQNNLNSQFTYINGVGYKNQDHFIIQGVETNLTSYFGKKIRWQNSYTHQKFLKKLTPLRRPMNTFVSALYWTPVEAIELFVKDRIVSARTDIDELGKRVKLNPYDVMSAGVLWRRDSLEVSLTVENIFNRVYEDIYATAVMPLSFWGNLTYRFM